MADRNATCALSITPETLSAWRDKQVKATTAEELARHVPTCAACQRELTQFEFVVRALQRQRELVPGNRVWSGVQARIGGQRTRHIPTRAFMGGISGIIVVVLLGFVFARLLGGTGRTTGPISATAITTAQPTATMTPLPIPSESPGTTFVTPVTIAQAWGANAAKQTLTTPGNGSQVFHAASITPDGTKLLGDQLTFSSNSKNSPGPSDAQAGSLDLTTRQFTDINVIRSTLGLFDQPACCMTDGRFLVAEDSSQAGVTCGPCHERFWSYDLQTRQDAHIVATGEQLQQITGGALDHGILVVATGNGFQLEDLATQQSTSLVPTGGNQAIVAIVAFTWPYLVYVDTTVTVSGDTTAVYVHNMTTHTDAPLPQNIAAGINSVVAITSDTLFYTTSVGTYEVDHFTEPGAQSRLLTGYTGSLIGVNARLLLFGSAGFSYVAWDRVEQRLVQLVGPSSTNGTQAALSGDFLLVIQPYTNSSTQQVAIYDTATLPHH